MSLSLSLSHLGLMCGTLWNDLPPLAGHQVEQLVDQERRRQRLHAAPRDRDQLAADGTPGKEDNVNQVSMHL